MMMSNQGVDHVIEKKKTNHVMVVLSDEVEADNKLEVVLYYSTMTWLYIFDLEDSTTIEIGRYNRYWYSASIAVTITYSAPIDVTAALCRDQSGAMTAIGTARRSL
ncbi:hypothetical protein L249_4470 [Ophiocordyceps polyrhachis-furcata BCC 54312]|uniref:Uncharacterized protein n=1 Tax=Ophiocordyceps polyrhachis-furcata BCC 54312 TaxID=1330021 RepID=A0A367L7R9_9HYPO|nr:hypothetical protein L249_4470 [Ophiocordyceps polyrhachis-furcata BCC 54312]